MRTSPLIPSATSSTSDGAGDGVQSSSSVDLGRHRLEVEQHGRDVDARHAVHSAWWVFEMTANLLPSKPWISQTSQSGFERSRRWEKMRPASWRSWSSEPGFGSAVWRTW